MSGEVDDGSNTTPPRPAPPNRPRAVGPVRFGSIEELRRRLLPGGSEPWVGERRRRPRGGKSGGSSR